MAPVSGLGWYVLVHQLPPRPLYLHCRTGADRTGLLVALYRIRHGTSPEAARREMIARGFRPYAGLTKLWRRFTPSAAMIIRTASAGRSSPSRKEQRSFEIRSGSIGTTRSGK